MRVVVVGTSGSGKTAMAKRIASALDLRFIELDRLHWGPNWEALTATNPDEFVRRVGAATSGDGWMCDGNYGLVRDLICGVRRIWSGLTIVAQSSCTV